MKIRATRLALMAALAALPVTTGTAMAQDRAVDTATLTDLRAELSDLRDELQGLRGQLRASGTEGFKAAGGAGAIDRMDSMEQHLARLTDRSEQLQNRIARSVETNGRRLADLEFRLCEMDSTCDLGALAMPGASAGVETGGTDLAPSAPSGPTMGGKVATAAEQSDFDTARAALNDGQFREAADLFGQVAETHAGGPLTAEALFLRGAALDSGGDPTAAAAAWLEGFAADPNGARAAESLLGIARVIEAQGDVTAACLYLAEIPVRFPATASATEAESRLDRLRCGSGLAEGFEPEIDGMTDTTP